MHGQWNGVHRMRQILYYMRLPSKLVLAQGDNYYAEFMEIIGPVVLLLRSVCMRTSLL